MKERRRGVRAIAFFRCEAVYQKKTYSGYIVNISPTGCAFAHEDLTDIEISADVRLKFRLDGKIVNLTSLVCWRDATLMGVRFKAVTAASAKFLRAYIRSVTLRRIPL